MLSKLLRLSNQSLGKYTAKTVTQRLLQRQHQQTRNMTISAWYMDTTDEDQRLPHKCEPNEPVSQDKLDQLGILSWSGLTGEDDPKLQEIRLERGYSYTDQITVSPDKLPGYETKILSFYKEHIHYDEEIRYCMEGSGYFDIRDEDDRWIRIALEGGDMIILPEGSYHRFTCDAKDYIKAMRLFVGEPVWTPYNREDIDEKENASRLKYVDNFFSNKKAKTSNEKEDVAPASTEAEKVAQA